MAIVLARDLAPDAPAGIRGRGARVRAIVGRIRRHADGRRKYSGPHANHGAGDLRRRRIGQRPARPNPGTGDFGDRAGNFDARQPPGSGGIQDAMIQVRIRKAFAAGPDSGGFSLDLEFQAAAGVTVLFGPSGSGKTLTLDSIAGFVRPDEGRILLDDDILFDGAARVFLPPQERHCGYVFQNYALFPHMTLRQNLEFAVERRPRLERHRRVNEMLERFRLQDAAGRRPHEVSGGQRQRCSIARALIGSPKVLLLDEPSQGLDAPLRGELYAALRQVRSEFKTPMLLVTHDLDECFELAEEMIVLREGRMVQSGPPRKILDQPANADVARLLGHFNLLTGEIR